VRPAWGSRLFDMRILTFDTAMGACSAAVTDAGRLVAHRHLPLSRGHAEALVPMIAAVLDEAGWQVRDLDRIGVTLGPGSFTGVRVGIATARALVIGGGAGTGGVSTLKSIAANALADGLEPAPDAWIATVCDARRSEVYVQVFDPELNEMTPPAVMRPDLVGAHLQAANADVCYTVIGTGASLASASLERLALPFRLHPQVPPFPDARTMAPLIAALPDATLGTPSPLYLRPPDAKLPAAR